MNKLIVLILMMGFISSTAQIAPGKYFIRFTDKNNNPYSLNNPLEFLTQRAIDRRLKQGVGYDQTDLPVTPSYILQVKELGAVILNPTKWLNGVTVKVTDTNILKAIRNLPFVESVSRPFSGPTGIDEKNLKFPGAPGSLSKSSAQGYLNKPSTYYDYGESYTQIHMVNGDVMHDAGYRGKGIVIAQLDAGYYHADRLPAFDSAWHNNRILGIKDFLHNGRPFFNDSTVIHDTTYYNAHGMYVLSIMAGNIPGHLIGSAPEADYWLIRTEDWINEYLLLEYNWVSGAEFADSVGADIITTSLGYCTYNLDSIPYTHTCADMDGHTAVCTKGANFAFSKGMVVVAAAGNTGLWEKWQCVSAPADADYAMAVAAVDSSGVRGNFSSPGVDTSGRIKPNLAALGVGTYLEHWSGIVRSSEGTSFSTPIIAGLTACLLQACPEATNLQVKQAIEYSGSRVSDPDSLIGYGIPDFNKARLHMGIPPELPGDNFSVIPNPSSGSFSLKIQVKTSMYLNVLICNSVGTIVLQKNIYGRAGDNSFEIDEMAGKPKGVYLVLVEGEGFFAVKKLIRLP